MRQTFNHVNNHSWDKATEALAPNIHHRVSGDHALGGERHDKDSVRRWFERLGRVLPTLRITVTEVTVKGWPWNTQVFAQWDGKATLKNGTPYINRGLHAFTLRWGRVYALEEFQDSQAADNGLAAQAAAGIEEAAAAPILS
ncbi:nuclear transport factor 2 family protein [Hyphomicrobium sp.]|uniref:nuclear transport factor 2 family protein n=1 Tax=Hyphomicrobium sp. TaxID=82 RepID=UPI00356AA903